MKEINFVRTSIKFSGSVLDIVGLYLINFQFCNTCDCGFTYRKTLIRHIQDKHPEEMSADISSQAYVSNFLFYKNELSHVLFAGSILK